MAKNIFTKLSFFTLKKTLFYELMAVFDVPFAFKKIMVSKLFLRQRQKKMPQEKTFHSKQIKNPWKFCTRLKLSFFLQ